MNTRVMALTVAASLIGVGCGDNDGFDPSIGDQSDAPTIADDRFEDIDVIVADACSGFAAANTNTRVDSAGLASELDDGNSDINSLELARDPNLDGSGAVASDRGDVLESDTVPGFCDVSRIPARSDDTAVAGTATDVCACEYPSCVAEAIADSFGCDVCVTFNCGDFDLSNCVACQ